MKDINIKIAKSKVEDFKLLIESVIREGYDIWLTGGQTEARLYLPESGRDIVLRINGTWEVS